MSRRRTATGRAGGTAVLPGARKLFTWRSRNLDARGQPADAPLDSWSACVNGPRPGLSRMPVKGGAVQPGASCEVTGLGTRLEYGINSDWLGSSMGLATALACTAAVNLTRSAGVAHRPAAASSG